MVHFFLQMLTRQADASPPVAWHDQHSDYSAPDEADSSLVLPRTLDDERIDHTGLCVEKRVRRRSVNTTKCI